MGWGNRYFEFDEPIRWFKSIGHSESNTWIGRSRVIDTVYEPTTINPGDQVHALVGGTFLVRADGTVEAGRLRLPKPILEKSYGFPASDADLLAMMAKAGRCREIEKPIGTFDYNSARKAADGNQLPPVTGPVQRGRKYPNSPLLELLLKAYRETNMHLTLNEAAAEANTVDVGQGTEPDSLEASLLIKFEDGSRISVSACPTRREVWVRDSAKTFGAALQRADHAALGLTPEFRNEVVTIFKESEAVNVMQTLSGFIAHGSINVPAGPQP